MPSRILSFGVNPVRKIVELTVFTKIVLRFQLFYLLLQKNRRAMGTYINKGNLGFREARNGEYVDKSGLISVINGTIGSKRKLTCVSRARRFGKSMAADMLYAYYDQSCDSSELFADLEIARDPSFKQHLNKYPTIYLDMTRFTTIEDSCRVVAEIEMRLGKDLREAYPDVPYHPEDDLMDYMLRVVQTTGQRFIFIIDEWDAVCRIYTGDSRAMDLYVNWLRRMFKDTTATDCFAAVYMTGILPIKKYDTQSALNNFLEYSMVEPRKLARFFGFTKDEVRMLAEKYDTDFDELEKWYDGYQIGDELSMFNPNSVIQAVDTGRCRSFWAATGTFDAVADYIKINFEGLKDDIIKMLAGGRCKVNPTKFQNDMSIITSKDDVLTVLIHLGYLSYDWQKDECWIPNREVAGEMVNAVEANNWQPVVRALQASEQLLQATLDGDSEAVARGVEVAHDENTSILSYNDENSLACVLSLAYYYARNNYIMHRELATGKGFADIVLIPRKNVDSPAIILELKVNKDADSAIDQIHRKQYTAKVAEYADRLLLVGISYDRGTKRHDCHIERI